MEPWLAGAVSLGARRGLAVRNLAAGNSRTVPLCFPKLQEPLVRFGDYLSYCRLVLVMDRWTPLDEKMT